MFCINISIVCLIQFSEQYIFVEIQILQFDIILYHAF